MSEQTRKNKQPITEEKAKKLIVASTVGAVLLIVILVTLMVYQLISIGVNNRRINDYNAKIAQYESLIEQGEEIIINTETGKYSSRA